MYVRAYSKFGLFCVVLYIQQYSVSERRLKSASSNLISISVTLSIVYPRGAVHTQ